MNKYKVRTTSINYCIEEEDVCWQFDNRTDLEEDSEEYYDAINAEIERLKRELPQHIEVDIECDEEDELADLVIDAVSNKTNWFINSIIYEILEVR